MKILTTVLLFSLSLGLVFCSAPTEPDSFQNQRLSGEKFWFVQADHYYLQSTYSIDSYAYVTLLAFDSTPSVTFVSAIGDTEQVYLHAVNPGHGVAYYEEGPRGGSIYLRRGGDGIPHDGIFHVGVSESLMEAIYYQSAEHIPLSITATIRP